MQNLGYFESTQFMLRHLCNNDTGPLSGKTPEKFLSQYSMNGMKL